MRACLKTPILPKEGFETCTRRDSIKEMPLFHPQKQRVCGVVDVGSDAIKALLFELPQENTGASPAQTLALVPRPIEKFVWELPEQYSGVRLARKIRECVFRMVQHIHEVPERILVALGPTVAESGLRTWRVGAGAGGRMFTRRDIRALYHDLFTSQNDLRRAVIAAPVDVLVNGYPLSWPSRNGREQSDSILPHAQVKEVVFRTLSMHMTVENGATFAEIKNALGGMPIEFIPLAVAYKEAVVRGLGVRDTLVVDVGGAETTVLSIRDGRFAHVGFMPLGTRRFAEHLVKKGGQSFRDAQKTMRAYAVLAPVRQKDKAEQGIAVVSASAARQWKRSFVSALDSFFSAGPIPETLLLTGGGAYIPELRSALLADDWMGNVSYARVPKLRVLDASGFFGGNTLGGHVDGPEDAGLAALAVYAMAHQPLF